VDWIRPEGKKVLLFAIPDQKIGPLVVGFFNHHLTFANVFLLYACLFFSFRKWPYVIMGAYLFLLCVWTQSRAAWAAIPLCLGLLVIPSSKRMRWRAVALVSFFFVATYFADNGFKQRFDRTVFQKDDFYNLGPRTRLWHAQWEIFKDHPWIGVGYNNNERLAKTYVDRLYPSRSDNFYGHAHNTPLQILATTGLLGSIAYLWLWGTIFWSLYQKRSWGLIAAFVGFQIQGLTQWNFGDAEVVHSLMFFWALAACDVSKESKSLSADFRYN
jgi:O-antigen ligase